MYDYEKQALARVLELEPRVKAVLMAARNMTNENDPEFCFNAVFYGIFKPKIRQLVGWGRGNKSSDVVRDDGSIDQDKLVKAVLAGKKERAKLSEDEKFLRSPEAYNAVYNQVVELLPPCRNCHCPSF